jgi:hypothetical protein
MIFEFANNIYPEHTLITASATRRAAKPCSIDVGEMASKLSEPRGVIPGNCPFLDAQYSADCGERPTRFWCQGSGRETRQLL